jgi:endoglucanase
MSRARLLAVVAALVAAIPGTVVAAIGLTATPANAQAAGTGTGYLRTSGNRILDSTGAEVRLTGINWFGMETDNHTFHGLWANPPATWRGQIERMAQLGFNTLRIPYTGDSLRPNATATSINSFTNPDLVGLHPLQILDRVIQHAGSLGMRVILDRHRPSAGSGITALWYTPQVTEQSIINDWVMLAQRYAGNTTVIGADLINEPHAEGTLPNATGSGWGTGGTARDWRLAAERIGNAILAVQPNWLILVEGVSCPTGGLPNPWSNPPIDDDCTWWGGNLSKAGEFPVRLNVPNRLVYSAHDYAISVYDRQPWFDDPNFPNNLPAVWDHYWGYLHKQNIAPVLIGEFGTTLQHPLDQQWLPALMSYMTANRMSFTFWSWNPNSGDTGGIALDDWYSINQTKYDILRPHLVPPVGGTQSSGPPPSSSPPPSSPSTGACTATYALGDGWPGNFQATVTVTNTGTSPTSSWTVGWTWAGNQDIYNSWNVAITESGRNVTARNAGHNGTIQPGQTTTFGIQGTVTGSNAVPSPITCTA